jgi:hypothetical protein
MITIYPLKYIELQKYYNSLTFTLNELTLLLNAKGFYKGKKINRNIAISKNHLYTSLTVLNNSLTLFYTFVQIDLDDFTYTSNNITFNSTNPDKPEFLLYLDDEYNCVNNSITLLSNTFISSTATYSLTSLYSLTSNISNLSYTSLTSLYSLTAEYCKNVMIAPNSIDIFDIPYSRLFVDTSFPINVLEYDSYYNINTKKLYLFTSNTWQEINWQNYVKSDNLYKNNRLRINNSTGALEIQSKDGIWHEIIPTIGATFAPISYTGFIYYIAPGQAYNGISSSIAPIIAINNMLYRGTYYHTYSGSSHFGIFPSGLTISNGTGAFILGGITPLQNYYINGKNYIPIARQANEPNNYANISIHIANFMLHVTSVAHSNTGPVVSTQIGYGNFPNNGYYLGIWCYEGTPISVDIITIRREL